MRHSAIERTHEQEIAGGERFAFGDNWARFLRVLDEQRIQQAVDSLKAMLEVEDLHGKSFLDIGSGSGLFSLAAKRLGAKVFSFDYDPQSVACTKELKRRYFENDNDWQVQAGSVLDKDYLKNLGKFNIVYSWGVLHHTGNMWVALDNIDVNVADNGKLFIALYNYQPFASKYWTFVKRTYNKHRFSRPLFVFIHAIYPTLPSVILKLVQNRKYPRGMSVWYDFFDWLGGYPFQVSKPEQIFDFYKKKGYRLMELKTVGGRLGCNEFVFQRNS
jgi:2-polyprenyl-6-hydroxyphenyl methylase/3-demethylubiquinone-9 3-methyltransferase